MKAKTVGDVLMAIHQFYTAARKVFHDFERFEEEQEIQGDGQLEYFRTQQIREVARKLEPWTLPNTFWFEGLVCLGDNRWRITMGS